MASIVDKRNKTMVDEEIIVAEGSNKNSVYKLKA